jgi:hypothetical protein
MPQVKLRRMARIHAPEIEDEPWFPPRLRDALTAFLNVSAEKLGVFDEAAPVLKDLVARHIARGGRRRVVDLCSGGGGPLLPVLVEMQQQDLELEAVLTDLYPNVPAFTRAEQRVKNLVGRTAPVDATDVPDELDGVRTLFNALHHFRPGSARKILEDAAAKKKPLAIFEIVERHPLTLTTIFFVPVAVLGLIPFSRPDWFRLLFTYLVPIVPVLTGWDGFASCLRAYNTDELKALARDIPCEGYSFTVGQSSWKLFPPMRVTWLVGEPTS